MWSPFEARLRSVCVDNFNDYYDPEIKKQNISKLVESSKFKIYETDFRDFSLLSKIFKSERRSSVIHLGAMAGVRYSIGRAKLYNDVNINGLINILDCCKKYGIDNFVFASTSSVYGDSSSIPFRESENCSFPLAPYPATKRAGELIGHSYYVQEGINFTALRFFSVYGPRGRPDMMPFMLLDSTVNKRKIPLFGQGKLKRDWTFVEDIVQGIISAVHKNEGYNLINLGRGFPVSMLDFIKVIEEITGLEVAVDYVEKPSSEPSETFADISLANELLNYNPSVNIREGLSKMWEWYKDEI